MGWTITDSRGLFSSAGRSPVITDGYAIELFRDRRPAEQALRLIDPGQKYGLG
jgi:hypothetical protein